ncbi:MAG: pyruvate kinase alpha/beta domain-containing protein [Bacillota bacterium]
MHFQEKGPGNTDRVAELVCQRARELGIEYVVVASNSGATARKFLGRGLKVVCVTHHVGFRNPGEDEMSRDERRALEDEGVEVLTTTHLFASIERAITNKWGGLYPGGIVSATLRCFGQGTKVCFEVASMALDAGLIPHGVEIIAIGGSGRGADTALVMKPAHAKAFFDTEVLEIICRPRGR